MFTLFPIHSLINILSFISITKAIIVNVTVDDILPDPLTGVRITYLPETGWKEGQTCTTCKAAPDGRQMYANTWHDSTSSPGNTTEPPSGPRNATFTFSGTAIYVFCALALASTSTFTAYSNMSFYIDGETVGHFERVPPGVPGYEYNVPVYSNTALSPEQHVLVLENGHIGGGGGPSMTLLDYLIYS
ncbi:hypothetical protein BDQ17DRAFT_1251092 [Cyathus striatus]|nr:hypothetical protein BDQ17DRAFT_1251092 [Cyathus striatus]